MKLPSIVIAADAGAAGRPILEHDGLSLWWALTEQEVRAAHEYPFDLIITREELADVALAAPRTDKLVLLEPDSWQKHQNYFDAGATGLVQASNGARIVEAVSELTGVAFDEHPWVEVSEFVSVNDCEVGFVRVLRLSQGGLELEMKDLRFLQGQRLELELDFLPGAPAVSGVVVRTPQRGRTTWGVAFDGPCEAVAASLKSFVGSASGDLPQPVSLTCDLGTCTLDLLMRPNQDGPTSGYRHRLEACVRDDASVRVPRWVSSINESLTPRERQVALGEVEDPVVSEAIDLRLEFGVLAVDLPEDFDLRRRTQKVIEFARSLAVAYDGASHEVLIDVMRMRASLLAGAYRLDSKRRRHVDRTAQAV